MKIDQTKINNRKGIIDNIFLALCAISTTLIIFWLIYFSAYGFDFTDESSYLVWMLNPFIYETSLSQFGFVYHPVYKLLHGDIVFLRRANILITFALAFGLVYSLLILLTPSLKEGRVTLIIVAAGFANGAFILFDTWLVTPNYNSLNLQGLLIAGTGLILAQKSLDAKSAFGWILIGIGSWLVFMAKPSSALILAVGIFLYLLLARKLSFQMLMLSMVTALLLLCSIGILIDDSLLNFMLRYQAASEFVALLGASHTVANILRIDDFQVDAEFKLLLFLFSCAIFLSLWSVCRTDKRWAYISLFFSVLFFAVTGSLTSGLIRETAGLGRFQGLLVFAVIYGVAITTLVVGGQQALKSISVQQWAIAALFLMMPYIYSFGTNNNYWQAASAAGIFWVLAAIPLYGPLIRECGSWRLAIPVTLAVQAITAILLQTGIEYPYRQPQSLRMNSSLPDFANYKSRLKLSEGFAEYISSASSTVRGVNFQPSTPMIDLTGQSPGILYAIGAESIGLPWTIGGYPGSLKLARAALERVSCEKIAAAWVLSEQNGPRSIPADLMLTLGADFPNNYDLAGKWQTAEGAGGYLDRRIQYLYKPIDSQKTLAGCKKLRERVEK